MSHAVDFLLSNCRSPPDAYVGRIVFKASVVYQSIQDWFILPDLFVEPVYTTVDYVTMKGSGSSFVDDAMQVCYKMCFVVITDYKLF
jgi:hypothetical protein